MRLSHIVVTAGLLAVTAAPAYAWDGRHHGGGGAGWGWVAPAIVGSAILGGLTAPYWYAPPPAYYYPPPPQAYYYPEPQPYYAPPQQLAPPGYYR